MNHEILIREISKDEEKVARDFLEMNLGVIDRVIFSLSFGEALKSAVKQMGTTLVAVSNGDIVGTVSLRIVVYGDKKVGLIDAIVVDKNLRGKGIGKSLLDEALSWLEKRECKIICATADRFNSRSWNIFIHKGFSPYRFRNQLRDLGSNFVRLWITEFYILGGGTFLLKKTNEKHTELSEGWHFLFSWLGLTLVWLLALRLSTPINVSLALVAVGLSIFTHELAHKLVAGRFRLETTFKAWDSGILFSSLLAILGAPYPSHGQTYVKQLDWRYDPKQKEIGLIYVTGPIVSLILATLFSILPLHLTNDLLLTVCRIGYVTNQVFIIFNLLPIQAAGGFAWDGRRIYTWNRTVWMLLVVALGLLILGNILL